MSFLGVAVLLLVASAWSSSTSLRSRSILEEQSEDAVNDERIVRKTLPNGWELTKFARIAAAKGFPKNISEGLQRLGIESTEDLQVRRERNLCRTIQLLLLG